MLSKGDKNVNDKDLKLLEIIHSRLSLVAEKIQQAINSDNKKLAAIAEDLYLKVTVFINSFIDSLSNLSNEEFNSLANEILKKLDKLDGKVTNEKKGEILPAMKKPAKFISLTDKVSNLLFDLSKNSRFYDFENVPVNINRKGSKPVRDIISLNIDELQQSQAIEVGLKPLLNPFNKSVFEAALSILEAGNQYFCANSIYYVLNGYNEAKTGHQVPEEFLKRIEESLTRLRLTNLSIDVTETLEYFCKKGKYLDIKPYFQKLKESTYLLPIKTITAINQFGDEYTAYAFIDTPTLLTYAKAKKQITQCDIKLLDIGLNSTEDNIILKNYLLMRIQGMKNKNNGLESNRILYETIFKYTGIYEITGTGKKRFHDKVKRILDAWIKAEFIKSYKEVKEGQKIIGIDIFY